MQNSKKIVHVGLLGASGRMGTRVTSLLETEFSAHAKLSVAARRATPLASLLPCDVIIDFALPEATAQLVDLALAQPSQQALPVFVIGSTGWTDLSAINLLSKRTPVIMATNFSTGVQAMLHILSKNRKLLNSLGYTPILTESHHIHKKDAPSGTAKSIQKALAPQDPESVLTHSIRQGEIIGDHEVVFAGPSDKIVLAHSAQDRSTFARGAIEVALWLFQNKKRFNTLNAPLDMTQYFNERYLTE